MADGTSVSSLFQSGVAPTPNSERTSASRALPPKSKLQDQGKNTWFRIQITKLKNQKLPAWRPVLYQRNTLWSFLLFGILFIPIGAVLITLYDESKEKVVEYTDCYTTDGTNCKDFVQEFENQKLGKLLCSFS